MAFVIADGVKETTSTTGTGTLTLTGAVSSFNTFLTGVGNGNSTFYSLYDPASGARERGMGTYASGANTLTRSTVLSNSLGTTALISFANAPLVWCDAPATFLSAAAKPNKLVNGDMRIDQRNNGASITPTTGGYSLDRWQHDITQSSKFSIQRNAGGVTPPVGFTYYLGVTSLSAYSVLAADRFSILQPIEGVNIADLNWGTANAQSLPVTFWVYSSLTGSFGASIRSSGATRSYPFSYTINNANTWELKTAIIPGDTSGTWLTTNGVGLYLTFCIGAGATAAGPANVWASANYSTVNSGSPISIVGTTGATFYLTGVKGEAGDAPTRFMQEDYAASLLKCQRYCEIWDAASGQNAFKVLGVGLIKVTTRCDIWWPYRVSKRTNATCTFTTASGFDFSDGVSDFAASAMATAGSELEGALVTGTVSGATAFRPAQCNANGNNTAKIIADAEL